MRFLSSSFFTTGNRAIKAALSRLSGANAAVRDEFLKFWFNSNMWFYVDYFRLPSQEVDQLNCFEKDGKNWQ